MDRFGILAILEAKPGKEQGVADFLKSARPLVLTGRGDVILVRIPDWTDNLWDLRHLC
jgi:hypothetical protein